MDIIAIDLVVFVLKECSVFIHVKISEAHFRKLVFEWIIYVI